MKNKQFLKSHTSQLFTCTFYFVLLLKILEYIRVFVLLILKYSKYQLLQDFYSGCILRGDFHFYQSHFPVRYLYFYKSVVFGTLHTTAYMLRLILLSVRCTAAAHCSQCVSFSDTITDTYTHTHTHTQAHSCAFVDHR